MTLKTDYKNISWTGLRKYQMIENQDGTVSFLDVTEYINTQDAQVLANDLNTNNDLVNRIMAGEFFYTEAESDALLALKQNLLTFDDAPTAGSNNPVKSSGIKSSFDAVNTRIDNLSVFSFYICGSGEDDPVTGQPTIQNPDTSTFYLVPTGTSPDVFVEWVYINNAWEKFGSTTVDLSNYVTISDLQDALDDKQDTLTFDSTPTDNSDNPVTSDGIYDALSGKSDTGHNHDSRYYTESEVDTLLAGKSDTGHNHDSRYYTESEVDTLLAGKSDASSTYTSAQVDTLLSAKVDNTSIGSMAAEDDAPSDGKTYGRKNGDWSEVTGGTGSAEWGDIGGTLSDQTDLQNALNAKAPLDSPALTGSPTATTPAAGNNSTRIATTAFVQGELAKQILFYKSQAVNAAASSGQIMRIPASGTDSAITTDSVVLEIYFADPTVIGSNINWRTYAGYCTFTGICSAATTANVVFGTKGN